MVSPNQVCKRLPPLWRKFLSLEIFARPFIFFPNLPEAAQIDMNEESGRCILIAAS
jgi:hypothetical protein